MFSFVLPRLESLNVGPRLGILMTAGRAPIPTPHYVASTSRGIVPHVAHDVLAKHTCITAAYVALEDFIEKSPQDAPIFQTPSRSHASRLRDYTALPEQCLSIFGPRRVPPVSCPAYNTHSSLSISTSVGFRFLQVEDYIEATKILKPDIAVSIADLVHTTQISAKRIEKCVDRTHAWLRDTLAVEADYATGDSAIFASIPPIEKEQQSFYLADLADEFRAQLSGVCLYALDGVDALPTAIHHLPRICLTDPPNPHAILNAVRNGVDMITVPFVTRASEQGIALSFFLPPSERDGGLQPLAIDLWSPEHAVSTTPLVPNCTCYTCVRHHRAYVHHLLQAKEMLAWTLLQIHNFAMIDRFFHDVRQSIAAGTFDQDVAHFNRAYQSDMPKQTGQGPRVRGYQMKSIGAGEAKKNPRAYGRLDDAVEKYAEAVHGVVVPPVDTNATELATGGFTNKVQ